MHIMLVLHSLEIGGAERMTLRLAQGLLQRKCRVTIAAMRHGGDLEMQARQLGVSVHTGIVRHRFDLLGLRRLARLIDINDIDAVILVDIIGDVMFYGLLGACLSRRRPARVGWVHNMPDIGYRPLEFINRMLARQLHAAVAVSRSVMIAHQRRRIVPSNRWAAVRNSFDPASYQLDISTHDARKQLNLPLDAPLVGMVGNFFAHKDQPTLLRAIADLHSRAQTKPAVVFAGDGDNLPACRKLADQLNLAEHAIFLGRTDNIPLLLRALDIFTLSSHHEGYNLAVMEANAAGLPVVATDLPPLRESLAGCMLTPPGDHVAMADAIQQLLQDAELRSRVADSGRRRAAKMQPSATADQFHSLLRHILAARPQHRCRWKSDELQLVTLPDEV